MGWETTGPLEIEGRGDYPDDGLYDVPSQYKLTCKYSDGTPMIIANNTQVAQGAKWYGENGWIHVNRGGLWAEPESLLQEEIGPNEIHLHASNDHKQDFLNAVRSRGPTIAPVEVGHRSISVALLGEIAMLTGRKLRWDPDTEEFSDDPGATALLGRSYREPWTLG